MVNINQGAALGIVAAIAQNVSPAQAAEAVTAGSNIVPDASTDLIAAVPAVSPEAAAQVLSNQETAAGEETTQPNNLSPEIADGPDETPSEPVPSDPVTPESTS